MTVQASARQVVTTLARRALQAFLDAGCTLDCRTNRGRGTAPPAAPPAAPRASILIPVLNHAELTLLCLQSLALHQSRTPIEIIVVDNSSTDETPRLLERVHGLRVVRNEANLGYPRAMNQAARLAVGDFLILLNNDVQLLGDCIDRAVGLLDANPDVGAVGGKVILLDGSLQEAGVTLGQDGWMYAYGVGESPDDPAYAFERDVDYCSGAFLATRRRLFHDLGGLDEIFSPGYFEECDYCARLWQAHWRVVYLPDLAILHFQNATSSSLPNLTELVCRNHRTFVQKQAGWLATRHGSTWSPLARRAAMSSQFHVLIVDEGRHAEETRFLRRNRVSDQDSAVEPLSEIEELIPRMQSRDASVTLCLIGGPGTRAVLLRLPRTVEVVYLDRVQELPGWLNSRASYYDLILSRDAELIGFLDLPVYSRARSALLQDGRVELI